MGKSLLYWISRKRWLLIGFLLGWLVFMLPRPEGLTEEGMRVLAIATFAIVFFVTEPAPLPTIALLIAVSQVLFKINSPSEVARSYMSDAVLFIMGSLMLSVALVKQRLDRRVALLILRLTGPSMARVSFGFVAISALIASMIGEHAVSAIMLPVAITLLQFSSEDAKRLRNNGILLLLSIGYGCAIAGLGTPSGAARNAIMLDYWARLFDIHLSYTTWIKYAYPLVVIQVPVVAFLLRRHFPTELNDLSDAIAKLQRQVAKEGKLAGEDWLALGIFALTMLLWITLSGRIGLGTPALIGVSLFLITGLVNWEDINSGVNWGVVLVYAAAISLGVGLRNTGAATWIAGQFLKVTGSLGLSGGWTIILAVVLFTLLVSNVISRGPAVAVLAPIFLDLGHLSGTSILALGFATALASSFSYLTVVGSPAYTIVYSSGYLRPSDFLKAGWEMTLISVALLLLLARFYWVWLGLPQ